MVSKKFTLAENIEWYWIHFIQGFYDFQNNLSMWKGLIFKDSHSDLRYVLFWIHISGEEIVIEVTPYAEVKRYKNKPN
jgi:hypothetical protein